MELKKKELVLLGFFRRNARLALTKISRKTGIPVSTIFDKLRKYEGSIIKKHTVLLDFAKLGYTTRASVFLKTTPENRMTLATHLRCHPAVNTVYRVNNGYDFMVEGIFRTVQDLEAFVEHLELQKGVTGKEVYFVIDELARENFMTAPELAV